MSQQQNLQIPIQILKLNKKGEYIESKLFQKDGQTLDMIADYTNGIIKKRTEFYEDGKTITCVDDYVDDILNKSTYFQEDGKAINCLMNYDANGNIDKFTSLKKYGKTPDFIASNFKDGNFNTIEEFYDNGEKLQEVSREIKDKMKKIYNHFNW